jgi:hypothetical protein
MMPINVPIPGQIAVPIALPRAAPPAPPTVVTAPLRAILPERILNYFPVIYPLHNRLNYIPISITETTAPIIQVVELPKVLINVFLAIYCTPTCAVAFIKAPHPAFIPIYPALAADAAIAEWVVFAHLVI